MLEWLFGSKKQPPEPPTEKQLRYARVLGINIPDKVSRATLSQLIGKQERLRKYGQAKIDEESRWQSLADLEKWLLVVFMRGKSKVGEVVRINGASISDQGIIKLEIEVMKLGNEKFIGTLVDVGRSLEIPTDKIVWYEIVDQLDFREVHFFQKYLNRVNAKL